MAPIEIRDKLNLLAQPKNFWYFTLGLASVRLVLINFVPVTPQEAYYWYYSQNLALSYFDHPPMAAYSIWLGTNLFGNHVFGVKIMAVVWSVLTNILLYFVTLRCLKDRRPEQDRGNAFSIAFLVVIVYNLSLFAHLYALAIMPDTPLLFFWILVIFLFQEALKKDKILWWVLMGLALGLGLVSKYTAIAVLPAMITILFLEKEYRIFLLKPGLYIAVVSALIVFLPVIYWNKNHHWVSFIFQFSSRAETVKSIHLQYLGQLLISQLFLLTPLIFVLFIGLIFTLIKNLRKNPSAVFFFLTGIYIISGFLLISLTSLVKMNWLLPGYLGLIIASVLLFKDRILNFTGWFRAGVYSSLLLIFLAHAMWLIPNVPLGEGNTWSGWSDVAPEIARLQNEQGGKKKCFIFANSYKGASLLKFYLPDQQNVYAQNIYGRPALQFDFWPIPDSLNGANALYVISDRKEYKNDLKWISKYFDDVSLLGKFEYRFYNMLHTRTIFCYLARNYKKNDTPKITTALY